MWGQQFLVEKPTKGIGAETHLKGKAYMNNQHVGAETESESKSFISYK